MNITNPSVPAIFNPRRRDLVIQSLSQNLGTYLSWLSHAWGKAVIKDRKTDHGRVRFPAVYNSGGNYIPVYQNSFLSGTTYFLLGRDEYLEETIIRFDTSIIFLLNLEKIYPTLSEYEATERIIEQVDHVIPRLDKRFEFESVEHDFDDVFREFDDFELYKFCSWPLASFRLNGIFTLNLVCLGTDIYPGDQGPLTSTIDVVGWGDGDTVGWGDGDERGWGDN